MVQSDMLKKITYALRSLVGIPRKVFNWPTVLSLLVDDIRQGQIIDNWGLRPQRTSNPLTTCAKRYWSQADEDGILEKIIARTGPETNGVFLEYGVGDGSECNTLALLARGWSGGWISGENLMFTPHPSGRLSFSRKWLTTDNILPVTETALKRLGLHLNDVDVVSLDLDGNDYHFTRTLLQEGIRPRVWISEYNARFPVGSQWVMDYEADHLWASDDYFGASISSFAQLFASHGYFPVACSATGANVFFVANNYLHLFHDVPRELAEIYHPPIYGLARSSACKPSAKLLASLTRPN